MPTVLRSLRVGRWPVALLLAVVALAASALAASGHHRFSPQAGFDDLPVTVAAADGVDVAAAVEPWNTLAGRTVFDVVPAGADAQVEVVPAEQTWVKVAPGYVDGPYESCTVFAAPRMSTSTLSHELGHCLGLADHVTARQRRPGHVNPADCTDHPYVGVMSYCSFAMFTDDDIRAVAEVTDDRYRRAVALVAADASADALVAGTLDADLLFVQRDALPQSTAVQLSSYDQAYIVGGPAVVSAAVFDEVAERLPVERLAGADRVQTAVEVARVNELRARMLR